MRPLLIAFRVGATIMAVVFSLNWLAAPGELTLERSRDWDVDSYSFHERAGRVYLRLTNSFGRRVRVNCEYYAGLCAHVRAVGAANLRVWTDELGYFASPSLIRARDGDRDIVTLQHQQAEYEARRLQRNAPLVVFLALAILAWRWPAFARYFSRKRAASR